MSGVGVNRIDRCTIPFCIVWGAGWISIELDLRQRADATLSLLHTVFEIPFNSNWTVSLTE